MTPEKGEESIENDVYYMSEKIDKENPAPDETQDETPETSKEKKSKASKKKKSEAPVAVDSKALDLKAERLETQVNVGSVTPDEKLRNLLNHRFCVKLNLQRERHMAALPAPTKERGKEVRAELKKSEAALLSINEKIIGWAQTKHVQI